MAQKYETALQASAFGEVSIAYRRFTPSKCNIDFALEAFEFVEKQTPCVVLNFDIKGFFDNLNHDWLLAQWKLLMGQGDRLPKDHYKIFQSLTRYAITREQDVFQALGIIPSKRRPRSAKRRHCGRSQQQRPPSPLPRPKPFCSPQEFREKIRGQGLVHTNTSGVGIPQGSPMSGVLSNVYMMPFDQEIANYVSLAGGYARRYSDDILLVLPLAAVEDAEKEIAAAEEFMEAAVKRQGLKLQTEKTEKIICELTPPGLRFHTATPDYDQPIQYLGLIYDGQRKGIRSQSLSRYHGRLRRYIKFARFRARQNKSKVVFRSAINQRYTHRCRDSFIGYAYRCARICRAPEIKKQVGKHSRIINRLLGKSD